MRRSPLKSGAAKFNADGDVTYTAKGAVALTAVGAITIDCKEDAIITGRQVRVTCGKAKLKGGGGTLNLGAKLTIDAKKLGGSGGPKIQLKGKINYK